MQAADPRRVFEVFRVALVLGLTSFGGPIAHLGYFERQYVRRRAWLGADAYAGLVALCQVLPGPASSQVGFLVGLHRAGWAGALAAWLGFTLPSAVLLFAAAVLAGRLDGPLVAAVVHGLKLVAVLVVAQAVWNMARRLCRTVVTAGLALGAALVLVQLHGAAAQMLVLLVAAAAGVLLCRGAAVPAPALSLPVGHRTGVLALVVFAVLLAGLPLLAALCPDTLATQAAMFYRAGALVFGGGHVVLPLLRDAFVPAGLIPDEVFLTGYGLAQAVPGPLFTVASWLGASASPDSPAVGALLATVMIFLPGLLVAVAGAALWNQAAAHPAFRAALAGLNAAVVGILAAALYDLVVHALLAA
jgi:chromate transporter